MRDLPPVLELMLSKRLHESTSIADLKRRVTKDVAADLQRQAQWTFDAFEYWDSEKRSARTDFALTPSGSLDPFSWHGPCTSTGCRVRRAKEFQRNLALYSDRVFIKDNFTGEWLRPRHGHDWFAQLHSDLQVLREMLPLYQRGIIEFVNPSFNMCRQCADPVIAEAARNVAEKIASELRFSVDERNVIVQGETILGQGAIHWRRRALSQEVIVSLTKRRRRRTATEQERMLQFVADLIEGTVAEVLADINTSHNVGSILASGSRVDVLALKVLERETPELRGIDTWELARSVDLPWISDLTIDEVLRLRDEAGESLKTMRELLRKKLSDPGGDASVVVQELRIQAVELSAELNALNLKDRSLARNVIGGLGLVFSLYGFASGLIPAPGAALGLFSILAGVHATARTDHTERRKLLSRPAYLLVRAKEYIEQRLHAA